MVATLQANSDYEFETKDAQGFTLSVHYLSPYFFVRVTAPSGAKVTRSISANYEPRGDWIDVSDRARILKAVDQILDTMKLVMKTNREGI